MSDYHIFEQKTNIEKQLVIDIKNAIQSEIERNNWSASYLANKLMLYETGIAVLFQRTWDLTLAIRIANALGLHIKLSINSSKEQ